MDYENMNPISLNTSRRKASYSPLAIFLHWVLAIMLIGMIALGWYMMSVEDSPGSEWYFMLHKSIGVIVGIVVLVRLFWRFGHAPNPLPDSFPKWQTFASKVTHRLMYVAMITMPLVGIGGALLSKDEVSIFGFTLPRAVAPNESFSETLFSLHSIIAWVLLGLISIHVLAALKHLISKDGVFQRMLPMNGPSRESEIP